MASLDQINVFEEPQRFSPEYFAQRKEERRLQKIKNDEIRSSVKNNFLAGDFENAYQDFTKLPVIDQLSLYMTPGLGNAIDAYEAKYFAEKSGRELKDPEAYQLELLMSGDPREVRPFTQKDPVSGAFSTLAGISLIPIVGEIPTLLKSVSMIGHNKGIAQLPKNIDETKDFVQNLGFLSKTTKENFADRFENMTDRLKNRVATKSNIDSDELDEIFNFVENSRNPYTKEAITRLIERSNKRTLPVYEFMEGVGNIKDVTRRDLFANNLVSKDGDVYLYRAINLQKGDKLNPDVGLTSTTVDPKYAAQLALDESKKILTNYPKDANIGILDTPLDIAMKMEGKQVQEEVIKRTPMIVEYKVPYNKVQAYLPAVAKVSDTEYDLFKRNRVQTDKADEIEELLEFDKDHTYDTATDEIQGMYDYEYDMEMGDYLDMIDKEKEALIDATDLKPRAVYTLDEFTTFLDRGDI